MATDETGLAMVPVFSAPFAVPDPSTVPAGELEAITKVPAVKGDLVWVYKSKCRFEALHEGDTAGGESLHPKKFTQNPTQRGAGALPRGLKK